MIKNILRLIRINQWVKNLFVLVPVVFSKHLFQTEYLVEVILAFFAFCFASSIIYILNDLFDIEADKLHPKKKLRPLASGSITITAAVITAIIFSAITILITFNLNFHFQLALLLYIILNIAYTIVLKHIVIVDIISIAAGFMIRVISGALVISVYISSWLILTTLFISLFLAIMKRRSELTLITSNGSTRKVLSDYSIEFTDQMATISAAGVIICYALYSVAERTVRELNGENLVFTTIFVIFGIFRFMYLVHKKSQGENATEIMITDIPMIVNILLYALTTVFIVYF